MKLRASDRKKYFEKLDALCASALRCDGRVRVSSAPCSEFLSNFLDTFPELTVEQGRRIVNDWRKIIDDRPTVKAAMEEISRDTI